MLDKFWTVRKRNCIEFHLASSRKFKIDLKINRGQRLLWKKTLYISPGETIYKKWLPRGYYNVHLNTRKQGETYPNVYL
jgi:hypothetical protein